MFSPLAFTKTWSMAVAAGLGITLVPVLMGFFIRGKIPDEKANPINRLLIRLYEPLLDKVLTFPKTTLALACLLLIATLWPLSRLEANLCRRWMKEIYSICPPRCRGSLLARHHGCFSRRTA